MRPLLSTQTDARLVALTRAGNERAFEAIVHRYRAPLMRYASRILPASRAEDAVQQAFLNAYEALGRSDAAIDLKPWLYRITHNSALNLLRQNGWDYDEIPPDFDGVMRPDQAFELGERLRDTVAAVKRLPDRQRDAIVLRELEGRSYEEIAAALGTGDGAVRQLLNRARAGMRSAATALTPWPLVARAAASPTGANIERAMDVAGAAGLVKVGVATLATAAVVGGSVAGPIDLTSEPSKPPREPKALVMPASERETPDRSAASDDQDDDAAPAPSAKKRSAARERRTRSRNRGSGSAGDDDTAREREDRSGPGGGGDDDEPERESESERERDDDSGPSGGGDDDAREPEPEREDSSGPGSDDDPVAVVEDNSGSGSSGSGSGGGDDDIVPTTETEVRTDNSGPGSIDDELDPD